MITALRTPPSAAVAPAGSVRPVRPVTCAPPGGAAGRPRGGRIGALAAALLAIGIVTGCDDGADATPEAEADAADARPDPIDSRPTDAATDAGVRLDAARADGAPRDAAPVDAEPGDLAPDADPLERPLVGQSEWGPAARVHRLDVPTDPDTARRAGCRLHGAGVGSRIYNLLLLAGGGLGNQVRPDGVGRIDLVVLLRARGWEPGLGAGALDAIDLDLLPGRQGPDLELLYRAEAFVDGDPANGAAAVFADTWVVDGWLDSDLVTVTLPLSILNSPELPLTIDLARLDGRIEADGPGFRLRHGTLAGYVTIERVAVLVELLTEVCLAPDAPPFCTLVAGQLDQPVEAVIELMVGFLGGLEARVEGERATPCDPELEGDCNALGVCLIVEAEPVVVEGVAPAP